ncbi:hypothetical protein HPB51_016808 [Rhipicephalus microplus]|uniref:Transposable element P transposase n=1 Tax=Rhipicephalus microplus TaxID=6941 RepID=A0A9J6DII7_RHIMP|nr:hypothetical protein HPB51_016808 [Rhipicephalus microplus]
MAVQSLAGNFSDSEERLQIVMKKTVKTLYELASQSFPHEWQVEVVKFVKQQVGILLSRTLRYPVDLLVFASLVFTISPYAYRFIRSTSKLKLPHPETIRRACGSYRVNPCSEQQDALFLSYTKRLAVGMDDHEKTVTLVMDEIHLQPYIDYKGGGLVGMATNSQNAAKTAYVFMIQSLLSSSKDVVHILPVAKIDAIQRHKFFRELINGLEATGFLVIAVLSDNNAINGKAMSFFSEPRKKLKCAFCKENLVVESRTLTIKADELVTSITRGGLKFPQAIVVNAVLMMNIVLEKLTSEKHAVKFYACEKQKELLVSMTTLFLEWNEDFDVCDNGHTPHVVAHIARRLVINQQQVLSKATVHGSTPDEMGLHQKVRKYWCQPHCGPCAEPHLLTGGLPLMLRRRRRVVHSQKLGSAQKQQSPVARQYAQSSSLCGADLHH